MTENGIYQMLEKRANRAKRGSSVARRQRKEREDIPPELEAEEKKYE